MVSFSLPPPSFSPDNNTTSEIKITYDELVNAFPLDKEKIRELQKYVLARIADTYTNKRKRIIIIEAPSGFGKSAVGITIARRLGNSYLCTSTKDLQHQYANDFPYLKVAKGMRNFECHVKRDFINSSTFNCKKCGIALLPIVKDSPREDIIKNELLINRIEKFCKHLTVADGPCRYSAEFKNTNYNQKHKTGCRYKTFIQDYEVVNPNTKEEEVNIRADMLEEYRDNFDNWDREEKREHFEPCLYYDQLYKALSASHTLLNYSNFLIFLNIPQYMKRKELLVLDEGHTLENEIIKFKGLSISVKKYKKYIPNFKIPDLSQNDVKEWIPFLEKIESRLKEIYDIQSAQTTIDNSEVDIDIEEDYAKVKATIGYLAEESDNWILATNLEKLKRENNGELSVVEFKPLDLSKYCNQIFNKCSRVLIMSATILNKEQYCKSLGLNLNEVEFIQVGSDFPIENRPIYSLDIVKLVKDTIQRPDIQKIISMKVNEIMDKHKDEKGIIHTTTYKHHDWIKKYLSKENKKRLIETSTDIQRIDVLKLHSKDMNKPTVLFSPSLHTGLDLKDDLSRFQIIIKVPYPDMSDRWTLAKMQENQKWYNWHTALRLVQAYGRSVRSKEDKAKTYVVDSKFNEFVDRHSELFPQWFMEALK